LKTTRIQDGIVRLYFVAGEKTIERLNKESGVLNDLQRIWSIPQAQIVETAERFFKDFKKLTGETEKQTHKILELQLKYVLDNPNVVLSYIISDQDNATLYFSYLAQYASGLKDKKKGVVFIGNNFIYGILGTKDLISVEKLKAFLLQKNEKAELKSRNAVQFTKPDTKEKVNTTDILQFSYIGALDIAATTEFFQTHAFKEAKL